ncbi:MAG: DUF4358 domain-containing protein [Oscillospiraceae bacterium]|nr:DUF4358 domain-containing protein [Oscillospiraceae bacterium]
MKYNLRKLTCALLAAVLSAAVFCACSDDNDDSSEKDESKNSESILSSESVDLDELRESMLEADESLPAMSLASGKDENAAELFAYLADYDYENVKDYFFSYASAGTAEEVAVIELFDADDAQDCAEAVKDHVEDRIILFETYDPTQVPRCEEAVVFYNDAYVVLIICDNDDAVKDAFYNAFEGD